MFDPIVKKVIYNQYRDPNSNLGSRPNNLGRFYSKVLLEDLVTILKRPLWDLR
jgi:hypothetical protein